jgi:hypothetical protein
MGLLSTYTVQELLPAGSLIPALIPNGGGYLNGNVPAFSIGGPIIAAVQGDGETDELAAVQAAINAGRDERRPVLLPGQLFLPGTVTVPAFSTVIGSGTNTTYEFLSGEIAAGTRVIGGAAGVLFDVDSAAHISNIGVDAQYITDYPFRFKGARSTGQNLEVIKAKKGGFLFAKTQNGTFINLCSKFGAAAMVLANGARNNFFDNFTSEVNVTFYDHPTIDYADADLILSIVDEDDALFLGTATFGGNDRNIFVGGINERAPRGTRWKKLGSYSGAMGILNEYHYMETTAALPFDNADNLDFGRVWVEGGQVLMDSADSFLSAGTVGEIVFSGPHFISGGANNARRGLTMRNNLIEGMGFDTDHGGSSGIPFALHGGGGTVTWNNTDRVFEVGSGGSSVQGLQLIIDGPGRSGNDLGAANVIRGAVGTLQFAISDVVGGSGQVPVYVVQQSSPFRRLLGNYAAGAHVAAVNFNSSIDYNGIAWAKGDLTSFKVKAKIGFRA